MMTSPERIKTKRRSKVRFQIVKRISEVRDRRRSHASASSSRTKEGSSSTLYPVIERAQSLPEFDDRSIASTVDFSEESVASSPPTDLVEYEERNSAEDISSAIQIWVNDTQTLIHSKEMSSFLGSSGMVLMQASQAAVQVAFLPVSLPMQAVTHTTGFVGHILAGTCSAIDRTLFQAEENAVSKGPVEGLLNNVTGLIPFAFQVVSHVKDEIGATVLGLICPEQTDTEGYPVKPKQLEGESSVQLLDRLRLDYPQQDNEREESPEDSPRSASPTSSSSDADIIKYSSDVSKYLLRTVDLALSAECANGQTRTLHYIDLSLEYSTTEHTQLALEALVANGMALLSSNSNTLFEFTQPNTISVDIQWKAEGPTEKLLRKKSVQSERDWIAGMQKNVLVWSGKLKSKKNPGQNKDVPLFQSRGIVHMSPLELLHLFWDNRRTSDYNKFCLGRSNSVVIENDLESLPRNVTRGTKIVKSETQVPFTGMTVKMSTLMHARKLELSGDKHCYMIVSRTVNPGRAGSHFRNEKIGSKNEIIWAVNLISSVPGRPDLSDLIALSQVKSPLVPPFLANRVGLMAVESIFSSLRSQE